MAFTSTDIANIDAAIASGELDVRFQDGRQVRYRSIAELQRAKAIAQSAIDADAGSVRPKSFRLNVSKGVFS